MQYRDKNHRPYYLKPQVENIPEDMRQLKHWILWKSEWSDDRKAWSKTPYQINGRKARSDDAITWSTFQDCLLAWSNAQSSYSGIGFVFSEEAGIYGIDLDNCITEEEYELKLSPYAARVLELLETYTEISPSKTGLHLICRAKDIKAIKLPEIEVYGSGRYFTVTGIAWGDVQGVNDATEPLKRIVDKLNEQRDAKKKTPTSPNAAPVMIPLTIQERLDRAFAARNGSQIQSLFNGDTSSYQDNDEGQSRADQALCSFLAFYSDGSPSVLDEMFRVSRLYRTKWDARHSGDGRTYGEMTIETAMSGCHEFYGQSQTRQPATEKAPALSPEQKTSKRSAYVFDIGNLAQSMIDYRTARANQQLISTGWKELDELYSPVKNTLSIITGYPNSGKSSVLDNLIVNLFVAHQWKFAVVSFETQPIELHALQIISLLLRQPWSLNRHGCLTDDQIREGAQIMAGHFFFHAIPEHDRVMDEVLEYVGDAIAQHGIDGFVFDPWAELNPPEKLIGSMTHFVQKNLAKLRAFTISNPIHTWLVAHPSKLDRSVRKDQLDAPDLYDVSDSAHFANKADYGLTVHRRNKGQVDDSTEVIVNKVRRGLPGRLGAVKLQYIATDSSYQQQSDYQQELREQNNSFRKK